MATSPDIEAAYLSGLRDRFATACIPLAQRAVARYGDHGSEFDEDKVAKAAYRWADAMMKARG